MTATPTRARQRTITTRALVLGTALAIGLTGCGGSDGDTPSDGETPMGALDKMFEEAYADWDEETSNRQQMEVEELVAECMSGLGFEYIPVDYSAMNSSMSISADDDEIQWGTLEFAEQWGYGITTNPWEEEATDEPSPGEEFVDPNQAITEAMSETELTAYYAALWGEQSTEEMDPEAEWVEPSWEEMGCYGEAQHEVYGDSAFGMGGEDDPFAELMEEMNRMWESISTDERILATESDWASCMADAGHPNLAKVGDAEDSIYEQVEPIWESAYSDMSPDATEEDYRAVEAAIAEQLSAITDQEIELAVADFTCREDVGYDDAYTEANLALQQEFYDTHKAELEEWIAYQKEQQG